MATPAPAPAPIDDQAISNARFLSYPKQVLYLVASFLALVSICHFISLGYRYAIRNQVHSEKRSSASLSRLPVAIADSFKALALRWTISIGSSYTLNLAEVGMALGYMGVLFSWTFVNTTNLEGVEVDPHYYADRAGTIAASQLPIMTALGMRNNLISWLTGIGFDKLNYLHRMSARVIVILSWIHAGGRITVGLVASDGDSISNRWIQCGFLASSTLTLLCILTVRPIREKSYELFLFVHFLFVFIFMLAIYFHLAGSTLVYYGAWPSMLVWGLDRFIRLVRLTISNFAYLNPWSKSSKELDASVKVLSPQFLRVTLYRPKSFHWRPGQSAYLSFPAVSPFPFQSHPFTMSTIYDNSPSNQSKLIFFLRVRSGFTAKLKQLASPDETYKVFINGPYGSPPILLGYQTVILIAGGSGVAFTLPFLLDLIGRAKRNEPTCQRVNFMWAIRDADQIKWIEDALLAALDDLPKSISVHLRFFVTAVLDDFARWEDHSNENNIGEKTSSSRSSQSGSRLQELPFVSVEQGRPDLITSIENEIATGTGPISINVCGTSTLASTVRRAIRVPRPMDVLRGGPTVSLHIEPFGGS